MTALEVKLLTWVGVGLVVLLVVLWMATRHEYDYTPSSILLAPAPASPPSSP